MLDRKYATYAVRLLSMFVLTFSVIKLIDYYADIRDSKSQLEEARAQYNEAVPVLPVNTQRTSAAKPEPAHENVNVNVNVHVTTIMQPLVVQERFIPLLENNPDVVGWLKIDHTTIDYPVVQAEDNAYYLTKDFHRNDNVTGSIFMDYRNRIDEQQKHWIIYGHYMKDEIMFKGLLKYNEETYYREHPLITFDTLYGDRQWLIFSAYYTDVNEDYIRTEFKRQDQFETFAKQLKASSLYDTNITVDADDTILTLSTCSRTEEGGRFTVHAKLITKPS